MIDFIFECIQNNNGVVLAMFCFEMKKLFNGNELRSFFTKKRLQSIMEV